MQLDTLESTAQEMVAPGRGILAMDESTGTCTSRFEKLGVESTEATRLSYREMLVTTPDLSRYISGAILFDETLRQKVTGEVPFAEYLDRVGIVPGIKVDMGAKALAGHPGREGHRRIGWFAREVAGVRFARRKIRQMARGDHNRRRNSE